MVQTRLIHRILPIAKYLKMCNIINNDICTFCNEEKETIENLFWECRVVEQFWDEFTKCLREKCFNCARLNLNIEFVLFGTTQNTTTDKPFDFVLLYAKFYIYKCKLQTTLPALTTFLHQLKLRLHLEESTYQNNNANWYPYKHIFTGPDRKLFGETHTAHNVAR